MKTQDKLNEEIMKILESTPGVVGFSSLIDEKEEFLDISIENNKDLEISLGLIINRNVTTKNLTKEIFEAINFNIKKNKIYTLKKLNVYIKGVK
ncbi:MAG: hypothetical protein IKL15_02210 [Mycoplasmataceae bacterium]|nr:hypothetical protein [Mycoplasmataceae bacterium]